MQPLFFAVYHAPIDNNFNSMVYLFLLTSGQYASIVPLLKDHIECLFQVPQRDEQTFHTFEITN
ncbi:MAG: hypothetical protein FD159_30 [Syntrophaceae bacterium]|nr:MAG: hypothetical protein FD159_30 [Syntrophaceae bacterium]